MWSAQWICPGLASAGSLVLQVGTAAPLPALCSALTLFTGAAQASEKASRSMSAVMSSMRMGMRGTRGG